MAVLKVIRGSCPGQLVELEGERMVMGRHPNCQIVLDNAAVSRNHAQILESHGSYFLEDLRSRNGTLINGQRIRGRTELHDGDEVKVCDVLFSFHLGAPPGAGGGRLAGGARHEDISDDTPAAGATIMGADGNLRSTDLIDERTDDNSSIISSLDIASARHARMAVRPEVKLRAVMEISTNLAQTLELDGMLPKILESLFNIFPQADRGFVVLKDPDTEKLVVKTMRTRNGDRVQTTPLSTTIIREAMNEGRAVLTANALGDRRFDQSKSIADLRIRSLMCAPLLGHDGAALGVIQIDTLDIRQQFSQDDLDVLASVAAQAALAVENATLHTSVLKQRDLERELEFATQVQLGFLPTERPKLPGYEFYDFYEAAYRVGGDFFDYVLLPDGRVAVGLGDVAGKGIPAALLMARLYSAARYELLTRPTAAAAMTGLNEVLATSGLGHRFVTLVFAIIDPRRDTVVVVNAGHMAPLLRNLAGEVSKVAPDESGLPLGVKPDVNYKQAEVQLALGDTLVLFTDGVTEAMNSRNEMYGNKRLVAFLEQAPQDVESLGEALVEDVEKFCEGRPQRDDVCLICFRRVPDPPTE